MSLENKQAKTSFGRLPLSDEYSAPKYSFLKDKRETQQKIFQGELSKIENIAKASPGPVYKYEDNLKFKNVNKLLNFDIGT